jgi:hypothetical protein
LEDILGKAAKLAEKRNELLHSLWFPPQELGGFLIQLKEDSQIFGQQRNPGEILTLTKEIEALRDEISSFQTSLSPAEIYKWILGIDPPAES